jgi:hypothetical protein
MSNAIGIDIGYGYTKSFTSHRKMAFPTAVSMYAPVFSFGGKIPTIRVNGEKFAVGEEIILNGFPYENTVRDDFVGSPSYMAVLGYVLSESNFSGNVLVTGLPPTFYNKERAEELTGQIRKQWLVNDQGRVIVIPGTVKIIPQGTGIFFSYVSTYPNYFQKNIIVIDVGYHTLDVVFFSNGKYIEGAVASFPLGIKMVYDEIRRSFGKTYGAFPKDDDSIDEIIRHGKYLHFGKEYFLDVREIIDSYRNLINSSIKSHAAKVSKKVDLVLAGGGGTTLFKETMKSVTLVDDPQFGNAKGFYEYGMNMGSNSSPPAAGSGIEIINV